MRFFGICVEKRLIDYKSVWLLPSLLTERFYSIRRGSIKVALMIPNPAFVCSRVEILWLDALLSSRDLNGFRQKEC